MKNTNNPTPWKEVELELAIKLNGKDENDFVAWNIIRLIIKELSEKYEEPVKRLT